MNLLQDPAGEPANAKPANAKCAEDIFSLWQEVEEDPVKQNQCKK